MNPLFRIDFSISDSLKIVRKSVLIYETIILSQRYDEEQQSLKKEIAELESICDKEDSRVYSKNQFLKAVRKFIQMKTLTPTMLHELVERIR